MQRYLEKYRNAPMPQKPYSLEEIRSFVESAPMAERGGTNRISKLIKGKTIMTIAGISILATALSIVLFSSIDTLPQVFLTENSLTAKINSSKRDELTAQYVSQGESNSDEIVSAKFSPVLYLNDKELASLGIIKTKSGYVFNKETSFEGRKDWELKEKKYNPSVAGGVFREICSLEVKNCKCEMVDYGGWDVAKYSRSVPIAIEGYWKSSSGGGLGSFRIGGYTPLADIDDGIVLSRERSELIKASINDKALNIELMNKELLDKVKYPNITKLIPILVNLENSEGEKNNAILWYVPTAEFVSLLPKRYEKYIKSNYEIIEKFSKAEIKNLPKNISEELDISGVETIELSIEELKKLNVNYADGVVKIISEQDISDMLKKMEPDIRDRAYSELRKAGYEPEKTKYIRSEHTFNGNGVNISEIKYQGWDYDNYLKIAPVAVMSRYKHFIDGKMEKENIVTTISAVSNSPLLNNNSLLMADLFDNLNKLSESVQFSENNKLEWVNKKWKYNISMLVPIHLKISGVQPNIPESYIDMIIWYVPTEEFLNALPKEKANRLSKEISIIAQLENGGISPEEACIALKGESSIFDLCRLSSEKLLELSIYPNPVSKEINVDFTLRNPSNISIMLHDATGKLVSVLREKGSILAGKQKIKLSLANIQQGAYLLNITNGADIQIVRRIIKE